MRNSALLGKWLWRFPRERSGLWHKVIASIYGTHPNGWDGTPTWWLDGLTDVLGRLLLKFSRVLPFCSPSGGQWGENSVLGNLWWGNQTLCAQFADLYRVISVRNLTVSNVLGNSFPLSWNFNFRRNLTDSEIDLLQRLMSSLHSVLLSPSSSDSRAWSLSSSGSFSVKSFFLCIVKRFKSFNVPSGQVFMELKSPFKGNGESIDHLFLHCPVTIGLWHRLFNLVGVIWVPPRSIEDMLVISFKGLGNSVRGKILWQIACLTLIWMVWQERNNRIFEDKGERKRWFGI
ncbi:hypothetical protein CK203_087876 [Vitis vinifera]|uniref:Reverse transcriptase zinc-binding domain-containing protein n=1 Tax=Vitis vinifera TaxID=29760 RepID=A0A438DQW1_VITVI|nr:hypothetical protein CK203_087876 [Vitis vinifera]